MPKRFYVQRQHIISLLDTLLYQLHTLSFFLSPTLWLYICRVIAQSQCSKPRELDSNRSLRVFYTAAVFLNLPSVWSHATKGAAEGRAIILDFVGMSYSPSKLQLCCLDLSILFLQLLLLTIAYETSMYGTNDDPNAEDILLPESPTTLSISLFPVPDDLSPETTSFLPSQPKPVTSFTNVPPFVLDLRLKPIITHLRNPLPLRMASLHSGLPLPNTTPFTLPGISTLLRTGRQRRNAAVAAAGIGREMRIPGSMVASPNR